MADDNLTVADLAFTKVSENWASAREVLDNPLLQERDTFALHDLRRRR